MFGLFNKIDSINEFIYKKLSWSAVGFGSALLYERFQTIQEKIESLWTDQDFFSSLCNYSKEGWKKRVFKKIEPLQPILSSLSIVGKIFWKRLKKPKLHQEIQDLKALLKRKKLSPQEKKKLEHTLLEKEHEKTISAMALLQMGSLAFSHPGSNIWNSVHSLTTRTLSLRYILQQAAHQPHLLKTSFDITLSALSISGTAATLLKQLGAIDEENSGFHSVMIASFIGMGVETLLLLYQCAYSLKNSP